MATAFRDEYITLVDGASALLCGSRAINCRDWSDLFRVGPSRGANRIIPGTAGRAARAHVRDELPVELEFQINGSYDQDNVRIEGDARSNCLDLIGVVRGFLDGATDRHLEVTLTTAEGSETVDCTFVSFGRIRFPAPQIAEFYVLISLPGGMMAIPGAP